MNLECHCVVGFHGFALAVLNVPDAITSIAAEILDFRQQRIELQQLVLVADNRASTARSRRIDVDGGFVDVVQSTDQREVPLVIAMVQLHVGVAVQASVANCLGRADGCFGNALLAGAYFSTCYLVVALLQIVILVANHVT